MAAADRQSLVASQKAQTLAMQLYRDGAGNFLDVVIAQVSAFGAETGQVGIDVRVQQASVNLVRALGGGWDASLLPTEKATLPSGPLARG